MRRFPSGLPTLLVPLGLLGRDVAAPSPDDRLGPSLAKVGAGGTTLEFRAKTRLLADGTVRVRVEAGCPPGLVVLEAFVTVSQDAAFGEAAIPADCTGRTQKSWVSVTALEGSFEAGPAQVSGFLLAEDPTTFETEQGQDTEAIVLR
jgi:hypothetical protein